MAQYVTDFPGNLDVFSQELQNGILGGSASASLEEESPCRIGNVRCCVQAYERYSYTGGNRVSLGVTMLESEGKIHLVAIATGGSQAMFFKINTFGEEAFLEQLVEVVERFRSAAAIPR